MIVVGFSREVIPARSTTIMSQRSGRDPGTGESDVRHGRHQPAPPLIAQRAAAGLFLCRERLFRDCPARPAPSGQGSRPRLTNWVGDDGALDPLVPSRIRSTRSSLRPADGRPPVYSLSPRTAM